MQRPFLTLLVAVVLNGAVARSEPIDLIDPAKKDGGWTFGNGPEFPGATGRLKLADVKHLGKPVLSIHGNFTKGGNYVHAFTPFPDVDLDTLSFWVNSPVGSKRFTVRIIDREGTVHQINIRYNEKGGWQKVVLPVKQFFEKMKAASSLDIVLKYESWPAAGDAKWRKPTPGLSLLASRAMGTEKGTVLVSDVLLFPSTEVATEIAKTIRLDELVQEGEMDWRYNDGREFKGGKGGLDLAPDQPEEGRVGIRLHGDFTGGGAYVGAGKSLTDHSIKSLKAVRMKMRSETAQNFSVRFIDGTGQCHQRRVAFKGDGEWHEIELLPEKIAGGEHWGGAKDGKWHDPPRFIDFIVSTRSNKAKKADLFMAEMRADVTVAAIIKGVAYREDFDKAPRLPENWKSQGRVELTQGGHQDTANALILKRTLEGLQNDTWASSEVFPASNGLWRVECAWKADLHSPDNSYHGAVSLEALNAAGATIEKTPVGIGCKKGDWQTMTATVELPKGATAARIQVRLNKTYGAFTVDSLSVSPVAATVEKRVDKILISTDKVGNLFFPGDDISVTVAIEALKPLRRGQQALAYSLRDYWGAEQIQPGKATLTRTERKQGKFIYLAEFNIPAEELQVGKFYQLHVSIPEEGEPYTEFSGIAILPKAVSKKYEPDQIPFTIRNWDSRVTEYFYLADRIGLRLLGVWGGWSSEPPYKPHLPGFERCKELGAKWITGTPAATVERAGFTKYSEEALRQGMKNFLEAFADQGLAMIATGNEPHGKGDKVLENVRAYKAIYETVKAFDPNIHVISTSVEPNREYFEAGYYNYLDSYDFHTYEHYSGVRKTFAKYRSLMKEFKAVKPMHSTELGLNSQGQTRRAVSIEMIKKLTVFFAEGGATVSWFTIQYPDRKGKARGNFGDAHCVFDCKWCLYNPRLDAITYYNMINAICVKKFIEEKRYDNGTQAYLFRDADGQCLQVLWLDDAEQDVSVPLPEGREARLIRLDGSGVMLKSATGAVSLRVSTEPALLLYQDKDQGLAAALRSPSLTLASAPGTIALGGTVTFTVKGPDLTPARLRIESPPFWKTSLKQAGQGATECTVSAPQTSPAREARLYIQRVEGDHVSGELTVALKVEAR